MTTGKKYLILIVSVFILQVTNACCGSTVPPKEWSTTGTTADDDQEDAPADMAIPPSNSSDYDDLVQEMKDSLTLGLGGGGKAYCLSPPGDGSAPALTVEDDITGYSHLCLWGFPLGGTVNITLTDPSGRNWVQENIPVEEMRGEVSVADIPIFLAGLPQGEWTFRIDSSGGTVAETISIRGPDHPIIGVVPDVDNYIFLGDRTLDCSNNRYSTMDAIQVIGAGFPPNSQFGYGLYHEVEGRETRMADIVYSQSIATDQFGEFRQFLSFDSSDPPGNYDIAVPITSDYLDQNPSERSIYDGAIACFQFDPGRPLSAEEIEMVFGGDKIIREAVLAAVEWSSLTNYGDLTFRDITEGQLAIEGRTKDVEHCRQLLAGAGYPEGYPSLRLMIAPLSETHAQALEELAASLFECGLGEYFETFNSYEEAYQVLSQITTAGESGLLISTQAKE